MPRFENKLSKLLADKFNHNKDIYDKAIDAEYIETHIGGPTLHHNLDGSHTWEGAGNTSLHYWSPDYNYCPISTFWNHRLCENLVTKPSIERSEQERAETWLRSARLDCVGD